MDVPDMDDVAPLLFFVGFVIIVAVFTCRLVHLVEQLCAETRYCGTRRERFKVALQSLRDPFGIPQQARHHTGVPSVDRVYLLRWIRTHNTILAAGRQPNADDVSAWMYALEHAETQRQDGGDSPGREYGELRAYLDSCPAVETRTLAAARYCHVPPSDLHGVRDLDVRVALALDNPHMPAQLLPT